MLLNIFITENDGQYVEDLLMKCYRSAGNTLWLFKKRATECHSSSVNCSLEKLQNKGMLRILTW